MTTPRSHEHVSQQPLEQARTEQGYRLMPQESMRIHSFGEPGQHPDSFKEPILSDSPIKIDGTHIATFRVGGEAEFTDIKIVDVRDNKRIDTKDSSRRQVGTVDDKPFYLQDSIDFVMVIPSGDKNHQPSIRPLKRGETQRIGRGVDSAQAEILSDTVSRDHMVFAIDLAGDLRIRNNNPTNMTKLLLPSKHEGEQAAEQKRDISLDEAFDLLSYGDVLDDESTKSALESLQSGNGPKYAETLKQIAAETGADSLQKMAEKMRAQCLAILKKAGVPASVYANSLSWAYWDLAKQRYLLEHPEESSEEYTSGKYYVRLHDPMEPGVLGESKRNEIVHRHIGWEIAHALDTGQVDAQKLRRFGDVVNTFYDGERNETGQHRSYVLTQIGRRATRGVGVKLNPHTPDRTPLLQLDQDNSHHR